MRSPIAQLSAFMRRSYSPACFLALLLGVALTAAASSAGAQTSPAIVVRNVTTNTTLFSDDFQRVSPVSTLPPIDTNGDYDPVANIGRWDAFEWEGHTRAGAMIRATRYALHRADRPGGNYPCSHIPRNGTKRFCSRAPSCGLK